MNHHFGTTIYVRNLIEGLKNAGVSVDRIIDKSSLKYFNYQDPDGMIPISVMYEFFELVWKDQKIDNMVIKFDNYFRLDKIGAYGELLMSSNLLLPCIQQAVANESKNMSHSNFLLNMDKEGAIVSNSYQYKTSFGQSFLENIELGIYLRTLEIANKDGWSPIEIYLTNDDTSIIEHVFPNHNAKILTNQKTFGVKFDFLSLSLPLVPENKAKSVNSNFCDIPKNLSGRIELLLENTRSSYLPTLQQVGNIFETSTSTIKRTLESQDQISYKKIVDRWRFMAAMKLLLETDLKIDEISDQLFYSNPANFSRAFKRWVNISPYKFRRHIISNS